MQNLYDQIGREAAVDAAVDLFYRKVMAEPRVSVFFEGVDLPKQIKKQKHFLTYAFGGPNRYSGVGLRNAHKRLVTEKGLNDTHFDIIIQLLGETLTELNVPPHLIEQAAAIAESTRKDVLNQ